MLRVTVACFLALALVESFIVPCRAQNFRRQLKDVDDAAKLLDKALLTKEFTVLKPELHHLALLGVGYAAANRNAYGPLKDLDQDLLFTLSFDFPYLLLNPSGALTELKNLKKLSLNKLKKLSDTVKNLCDKVPSDNECDRLVNALISNDQALLKDSLLLKKVSVAASGLLAKEPRLQEVAKSLDVVSYLVANFEDAKYYVRQLSHLLKALSPRPMPRPYDLSYM